MDNMDNAEVPQETLLEEVSQLINQLKPQWKVTRGIIECGSGFVSESIFAFGEQGYYWIVNLCDTGTFAFKKINDTEWLEVYANLILRSPEVFVVYDITHQIEEWSVAQPKLCLLDDEPKMTRAV